MLYYYDTFARDYFNNLKYKKFLSHQKLRNYYCNIIIHAELSKLKYVFKIENSIKYNT